MEDVSAGKQTGCTVKTCKLILVLLKAIKILFLERICILWVNFKTDTILIKSLVNFWYPYGGGTRKLIRTY